MKKKKNYLFTGILSLSAICLLTACGGSKVKSERDALAKENVFSIQKVSLDQDWKDSAVDIIKVTGNKVSMLYSVYDAPDASSVVPLDEGMAGGVSSVFTDEGMTTDGSIATDGDMATDGMDTSDSSSATYLKLVTCDLDGNNGAVVDITTGKETQSSAAMYNFDFSPEGNAYVTWQCIVETSDSTPDNPVYVNQESLACYSGADGSTLWETVLTDPEGDDGSSLMLNAIKATSDGNILLLYSDGGQGYSVMQLDHQGNITGTTKLDLSGLSSIGNIYIKDDSTLFILSNNDDGTAYFMSSYDLKTNSLGEKKSIPFSFYSYSTVIPAPTDSGTDLLLSDLEGIYTYTIGDEAVQKVMDFVNSDLPTNTFTQLAYIDATHLAGAYHDEDENNQLETAIFTKIDPKDVADRTVLVLGIDDVYLDLSAEVRKFNQSNEKFRIVIKDYSDDAAGSSDANAPEISSQLNSDILSDNAPDILATTSNVPLENYIAKGLLVDMKPYLEKDTSLSGQSNLDNVFQALSDGDKWYCLAPGFYVDTVVGKTSVVGDTENWTFDAFQTVMNSLPEGTKSFTDMTKQDFLGDIILFCGNDFIDAANNTCSFNSPAFIQLLDYANTFPDTIDYTNMDPDYWDNYQQQFYNNQTILEEVTINTVADYENFFANFGEELTFVGFPSDSGKGSALTAPVVLSITSKSKYKDDAWSFISNFFQKDYQATQNMGMPVVKETFLSKANEAVSRPYYLDENGQKVEYDQTAHINGEDVTIPPLTQDQVNKVTTFLTGIHGVTFNNSEITNILTEEAGALFSGQKTASEVADIIQNRVALYLKENN
jgi:hypothetical protein